MIKSFLFEVFSSDCLRRRRNFSRPATKKSESKQMQFQKASKLPQAQGNASYQAIFGLTF